jgi:lysophospholipase L1-like esterase
MQDGSELTLTTAKAKDLDGVSISKAPTDVLGLGFLPEEQVAHLTPYANAYSAKPAEDMKADLMGLDVLALGDSTFAGDEFGWDWQWINWMASDLAWNLSNLSYGGASISYTEGQNQASIVHRLETEAEFKFGGTNHDGNPWRYSTAGAIGKSADEVDLIILSAGFNDYGGSGLYVPIGEKSLENRDTTTYIGAWNVVLDKLQEQYVNAKILIINQWHLDTAYAAAQRGDTITCYEFTNSIAEMYHNYYYENDRIFLLDSGDPDISGIYMMDSNFRLENSRNPSDVFHLNKTGMEKMKNAVLPYIWNYLVHDVKEDQ